MWLWLLCGPIPRRLQSFDTKYIAPQVGLFLNLLGVEWDPRSDHHFTHPSVAALARGLVTRLQATFSSEPAPLLPKMPVTLTMKSFATAINSLRHITKVVDAYADKFTPEAVMMVRESLKGVRLCRRSICKKIGTAS